MCSFEAALFYKAAEDAFNERLNIEQHLQKGIKSNYRTDLTITMAVRFKKFRLQLGV